MGLNLTEVDNYCVPRPTQPLTLSGTGYGYWVVAYGVRGEGLAWLIGVVVYLWAAPPVQLLFIGADEGWPHNAPRYY